MSLYADDLTCRGDAYVIPLTRYEKTCLLGTVAEWMPHLLSTNRLRFGATEHDDNPLLLAELAFETGQLDDWRIDRSDRYGRGTYTVRQLRLPVRDAAVAPVEAQQQAAQEHTT